MRTLRYLPVFVSQPVLKACLRADEAEAATCARGLVASTQKGLQQQNSVEGDANAGSDVCSRE